VRRWVKYALYGTIGAVVGWVGYQSIARATAHRRSLTAAED
jgi:hypothetical protein